MKWRDSLITCTHPMGHFARAVVIVISVACLLQWSTAGVAATSADPTDRLVLAFYYTWFDENSWSPSAVPDQPVAAYVSRDRAVMERQISEAKLAGIDAFVVSWLGPREADNQTETNLRVLLDVANQYDFKIAVDFEVTSTFIASAGEAESALGTLLSTHANHSAYLRWHGKPVVFFWRQGRYSTETWRGIRDRVDPSRSSVWIEEGTDVSPLSVFDGHHLYSVSWNPPTDMGYTASKFARLVHAASASYGVEKIYVATVMPGYDDRKTGRLNAFAIGREGGAYYERSWQAALSSEPDWIVITSYNEWPEGTYIEPSTNYSDLYLQLTAKWAANFRAGVFAQPAAEATPVPVQVAETLAASEAAPVVETKQIAPKVLGPKRRAGSPGGPIM